MNVRRIISGFVSGIAAVATAAVMLISCHGRTSEEQQTDVRPSAVSHSEVLRAVPTDAAAVLCFQSAKSGLETITDETSAFSTLISGSQLFRRFIAGLKDASLLRSQHMAISVHYTGSLEPLMIVDYGKSQSDTTSSHRQLMSLAEEANLSSDLVRKGNVTYIIISASETMVNSSKRHLSDNASILDDPDFASLAKQMSSKDVVFFSNNYSDKLISSYFGKSLRRYSSFVKKAAEWTALDIRSISAKHIQMEGRTACSDSRARYMRVLSDNPSGECLFAECVPESAWYAIALGPSDIQSWYDSYTGYLDASSMLQKHLAVCDTVKARTGMNLMKWASEMKICEAVVAGWNDVERNDRQAVFFRSSKARKSVDGVHPFTDGDAVAAVFGNAFSVPSDAFYAVMGNWTAIGDEASVNDWTEKMKGVSVLQNLLEQMSVPVPGKGASMAGYFSLDRADAHFDDLFRSALASDLATTLDGVAYEPMVFSFGKDGFAWDIYRLESSDRSASGNVARAGFNTQVEVPAGPFRVMNSATGRVNLFYQNQQLSLCLKEESGKGLWGVPFKTPICGSAVNVDYYANGKLQILFAAGSSLYIIDRTGRFVSGFPVDLGKEILLGPELSGEPGAYRVMVLHTDNTVGVYDLDGQPDPAWLGIQVDGNITAMPALVTSGGKACRVVRTSTGTHLFGPDGGEPLYTKTGSKAISRDSAVEVSEDGTVTFTCNDGRKRKIQL